MSEATNPREWRDADIYRGPGMTAYVRTSDFENSGNNEGTITWDVAVCADAGDVLLRKTVYHEWEYHTALNVKFAEDRSSVTLSVEHGETKTYQLGR